LFFPALLFFSLDPIAYLALPLAVAGFGLAAAGAALVALSRMKLGAAWSLTPSASEHAGLVTSGPYGVVRHPIYLGFVLATAGQAVAFGSWPALAMVALAIVPTFAWRARAEEELLIRTFGERYASYRRQTKLIIPRLL
jgi:protein-S-isoprenylcysteine O-methyltransferase Ste14